MEVRFTLLMHSIHFGATGPRLSLEVGDNGAWFIIVSNLIHNIVADLGLRALGRSRIAWFPSDSNSKVKREAGGQAGDSFRAPFIRHFTFVRHGASLPSRSVVQWRKAHRFNGHVM